MKKTFLDEFIHLEKLCNDMYGCNHGVSKYIEDMEKTSGALQNRIPLWRETYKKLKEIRWKRNQFVHEGNVVYTNSDTAWLSNFYKQIINGEDPLSIRRKLQTEMKRQRTPAVHKSMSMVKHRRSKRKWKGIVYGAIALTVIVIIAVLLIGLSF